MKMKIGLAAIVGAAALSLAVPAFGQNAMKLTGANDGISYDPVSGGSAYGGLYQGTINGIATNIICDDAEDTISVGLAWKATAMNATQIANNLGSTMFDGTIGVIGYAEVATLVEDVFNNATTQGDRDALSSAIWAITYNHGTLGLSGEALTYYTNVTGKFGSNASAAAIALGQDGNLWLLTPSPNHSSQEFWVSTGPNGTPNYNPLSLRVPEGGSALLYLLLAGLTCFGTMRFRSKKEFGIRAA